MIRLVVVDDHPVVRHGLVSMLGYEKDLQVIGEAANGQDAIKVILEQKPDVTLLDLRMPGLSGIDVLKQVHAQLPHARFLVLTTYDTDEYIIPALSNGAQGYLLKDTSPDELIRAIHSIAQGGAALESGVAARFLENVSGQKTSEDLSERELEVVRLLVSGASNKSIAAQLDLSENTVKTHLSHIFDKLNVQSRAEAVSVALQRGVIRTQH
jgi:DNA-binding NarL/FixJ family response regulator